MNRSRRFCFRVGPSAAMLVAVLTMFIVDSRPASALGQECMATYYRTKSSACIDGILSEFRSKPRSDPNTLTGFLAELFRSSPEERDRILKAETADFLISIDLAALWLGGLTQEAETYAKAIDRTGLIAQARRTFPIGLDAVTPSALPRDNDLLIGAYMASGNRDLITRILANYSTADDGMVADGLRMGLMMGKFGPNLKPPSREPVMTRNACDKYQCKTDQQAFLRVLTLATAFWSLQSLSGRDEGIKVAMASFFLGDARMKRLFTTEQAAFGNYITLMVGAAAFKTPEGDEQQRAFSAFDRAATIYENFGSANDALAPIQSLPARPAKN